MQSPEKTKILELPVTRTIVVGLLFILLIGVFFLVTRGSSFCVLTIGSCNDVAHPTLSTELIGAGAGVASVVALTTIIEAPVMVAVGVGIVVWWVVSSLLH